MLLGGGRRFRDIVHWRQQSDGQLRFTPLYSPRELTTDRKDQILVLALHLVCNYPRLLYVAMASAEVRFIATPVEHPASAFVEVDPGEQLCVDIGSHGPPQRTPVESQEDLHRCLQMAVAPSVKLQYVHPHPALTRMVCLWVGRRRWSRSRAHFEQAAAAASRRRGWKERTHRMKDWRHAGAAAAAGVASLEWKRLRRILGLNGWGEQLLYRVKTKAFSLYDPHPDTARLPPPRVRPHPRGGHPPSVLDLPGGIVAVGGLPRQVAHTWPPHRR